MTEWVTTGEAGRRLGVTPQALGQWAMRPYAPVRLVGTRREYQWPAFPRWREQELARQAVREVEPRDIEAARCRKVAAEARLAELELALAERTQIPIEEAAHAFEAALSHLRSQLVTLPQRWAPDLVGLPTIPAVTVVLERVVAALMGTLSGRLDEAAIGKDGD